MNRAPVRTLWTAKPELYLERIKEAAGWPSEWPPSRVGPRVSEPAPVVPHASPNWPRDHHHSCPRQRTHQFDRVPCSHAASDHQDGRGERRDHHARVISCRRAARPVAPPAPASPLRPRVWTAGDCDELAPLRLRRQAQGRLQLKWAGVDGSPSRSLTHLMGPVHRRLHLPLEAIGPTEIARLGRVRAMPDHQAARERSVHLAASERRGGHAERRAAAAFVHRHGLEPDRCPHGADAG